MERNKYYFNQIISRDLQSKLPYLKERSLRLESISLHLSLKEQKFQAKTFLLPTLSALEILTGQKPQLHFSKKGASELSLERGSLCAISVKLRSETMYAFLEEFRTLILGSYHGFGGLSFQSLDQRGNLGFRLDNLARFPVIEEEYLRFQGNRASRGGRSSNFPLDIYFHTSAQTLQEGKLLLSAFQLPIIK